MACDAAATAAAPSASAVPVSSTRREMRWQSFLPLFMIELPSGLVLAFFEPEVRGRAGRPRVRCNCPMPAPIPVDTAHLPLSGQFFHSHWAFLMQRLIETQAKKLEAANRITADANGNDVSVLRYPRAWRSLRHLQRKTCRFKADRAQAERALRVGR